MNPEVKAEWLAALRSGEFEQGKNRLANDGKYCCLGVLCELAVRAGVAEKWVQHPDGAMKYGHRNATDYSDKESGVLPYSVQRWANMPDNNPDVFLGNDAPYNLAALNDDGRSFDYIADAIEESL